jgi:hypothetical protein
MRIARAPASLAGSFDRRRGRAVAATSVPIRAASVWEVGDDVQMRDACSNRDPKPEAAADELAPPGDHV